MNQEKLILLCNCKKCNGFPKNVVDYPAEGAGFAFPDRLRWIECQDCGNRSSMVTESDFEGAAKDWNKKQLENEPVSKLNNIGVR